MFNSQKETSNKTNEIDKKFLLQFLPFSTLVDSSFWFEVKRTKLDDLKLDVTPVDIVPSFSIRSTIPGLVTLNYESFHSYEKLCNLRESGKDNDLFYLNGKLIIYNTREDFDTVDKRDLIHEQGKMIWKELNDASLKTKVDTNLEYYLARFLMIVYGNYKSYDFIFWNAFPSLVFPPNCYQIIKDEDTSLEKYFHFEQVQKFFIDYNGLAKKQRMFYVIMLKPLGNLNTNRENKVQCEQYELKIISFIELWSLNYIEQLIQSTNGDLKIIFALSDFSTSWNPGWLLRNYITYIHIRLSQLLNEYPNNDSIKQFIKIILFSKHLTIASIQVGPYTLINADELDMKIIENIFKNSRMHHIALLPSNYKTLSPEHYMDGFIEDVRKIYNQKPIDVTNKTPKDSFIPPTVGWERNRKLNNRLLPNHVNCSNTLNPDLIATDALYLNLKLMKWRLVESLDLECIRNTRCLLLGSGTLGCNIARTLVSWGIEKITMVDNKYVSFSNPSRQSLFTYEDAIGGGKVKAQCAAKALQMINPSIKSKGVFLNIKMPGHLFEKSLHDEMKEVEELEKLINDHDVVFLLMDTKESRWLPTVIAMSKHKIIINVALGFDSFLVQRFGIRIQEDDYMDQQSPLYELYQKQKKIFSNLLPEIDIDDDEDNENPESKLNTTKKPLMYLGSELGCYFCNDVFSPTNSTKNRTLDQQCTVTRPGLSMIASGYATELLVSILQHPASILAPALASNKDSQMALKRLTEALEKQKDAELLNLQSLLGIIPHEFRGFLSFYEHMTPAIPRLECCVACSSNVINQYRKDKVSFIDMAINDSKSLEKLTGVEIFHKVDGLQIEDSLEDDF